jgi:hypothetical protein
MPTSNERFTLDLPGCGSLDRDRRGRGRLQLPHRSLAASGAGVQRLCALFVVGSPERVNFRLVGRAGASAAAAGSSSSRK